MPPRIPEMNKQPGLCYAYSDSGLELPVIDVSHPAFKLTLSDAELFARAEAYVRGQRSKGALARWAQRLILPFFLRRSLIGRGLLRSRGSYLDGLSTYLMKLGSKNLGAYASPMDRKLVAGLELSGLSVALRLQDMAQLLAEALAPLLLAGPQRPLHLLNIAGGPSMDSLNALILLRQAQPEALEGREIRIHVLDLEIEGVHFASAALEALLAPGAPLQGLGIRLEPIPYDWSQRGALEARLRSLPADAIVALSSEGGLFDYGSDADVRANLSVYAQGTAPDSVLAASISRPDGAGSLMRQGTVATIQLRSLEDLGALAQSSGWKIAMNRSRPMNFVVSLEKNALSSPN